MTIRCRDEAELWLGTSSLWLDDQPYEVEEQRGYKDRWVVKLAGIDDANDAAQLRGATVTVEREAAPQLGDFEHWHEDLVDLEVVLVDGSKVGRVRAVQPGPQTDLLVVTLDDGSEALIPMHREIVTDVAIDAGRVTIDPPEGLLSLNA